MGLSLGHLIVLLVIIMLFGPKRVSSLGAQLGKSLRAFKDSLDKVKDDTGLGEVTKSMGDFQNNVKDFKDSVNPLKSSPMEEKKMGDDKKTPNA
jgi:TatA/E family protein of Tat protein translocase